MSLLFGLAREMTNTTITPVPINRFPDIINDTFGGNQLINVTRPNWGDAIYNLFMIYPDALGIMAYVLISLIPFAMMWISQGNARMAAIVGCIEILFIAAFLPESWVYAASGVIVLTLAVTIYGLYKGTI